MYTVTKKSPLSDEIGNKCSQKGGLFTQKEKSGLRVGQPIHFLGCRALFRAEPKSTYCQFRIAHDRIFSGLDFAKPFSSG